MSYFSVSSFTEATTWTPITSDVLFMPYPVAETPIITAIISYWRDFYSGEASARTRRQYLKVLPTDSLHELVIMFRSIGTGANGRGYDRYCSGT